ncbi:MAG: hypothetical protein WC455_17465 [Dehalococcoidia bacterium]|jgi:hypothetical protein
MSANIHQKCPSKRQWHDVVLRRNATMSNDNQDEVIARFKRPGDAYMWAVEVSRRYDENYTIICD